MFARNFVDDRLCWADDGSPHDFPCNKPGVPPLFLCEEHLEELKPSRRTADDVDDSIRQT